MVSNVIERSKVSYRRFGKIIEDSKVWEVALSTVSKVMVSKVSKIELSEALEVVEGELLPFRRDYRRVKSLNSVVVEEGVEGSDVKDSKNRFI